MRAAGRRAARRPAPATPASCPRRIRPDPIELLEEQAKRRTPDLVPIRYGRMVSSPFAFYRGGAAIMAADLATTPRSGIETQLCGDAHLSNFGGFMTPERTHVFGLNDFDETRTGPWEWDVKRLATSFEVAARDRGFSESQRDAAVIACLRAYTSAISQFAAMRNLDLWYLRLEADRAIATIARRSDPTYVRQAKADVAKSRSRDHLVALAKLTTRVDGKLRFRTKPPLVVRAKELSDRGAAPRLPGHDRRVPGRLPAQPLGRASPPARWLPLRRHGPQGRWGRQRRDALLDGPDGRQRRCRSADPPAQGGDDLRPGPVSWADRVRARGTAGGRRPAPDAGRLRHPAGLVPDRRRSRASSATSTSGSCGMASSRRISIRSARRAWSATRSYAAGPSAGPTPAPEIGSRLPGTLAAAGRSRRPSRPLPGRTPTRMSGIGAA